MLTNLKGQDFPIYVNEEALFGERELVVGDVLGFQLVSGATLHFRLDAPALADDATVTVRRASCVWRVCQSCS